LSFITKEKIKNNFEEKEDLWKNPTFGDMKIIKEFADEQNRCRGFHRVYPKRATLQNYKMFLMSLIALMLFLSHLLS
jgi:tubulin polyglutamylase TTLL4